MIHNDFIMFGIMILSGLLSTMSIWSDKLSHVSITLNDIYMVTLMNVWMVLFMGLFYLKKEYIVFGFLGVFISLFFIRKQTFINKKQYFKGMLTHHSMAVFMSKKLLDKKIDMSKEERLFIKNIIESQEKEIMMMKKFGY